MMSILSLGASVAGVAIVMGHDPTGVDLLRAAVCFIVAIGISITVARRR